MTATLTIVLLCITFLLMALLAMPGAVLIAKWVEGEYPGLLENLAFWAGVLGVGGLVFYMIVGPYL